MICTFCFRNFCISDLKFVFMCSFRACVTNSKSNDTFYGDDENQVAYLTYIGLSTAAVVLFVIHDIPFLATAAQSLHDSMFHRVMMAPSRFFDITPVGKVVTFGHFHLFHVSSLINTASTQSGFFQGLC